MKKISAKAVIGKVLRDIKPASASFEYDAMSWIGEAIEFIGHHAGFTPKTEVISLLNNRALLPCDFHMVRPRGVRYNGSPLAFGYNGTSYEPPQASVYVSSLDQGKYGKPVLKSEGSFGEYYLLNDAYLQSSLAEGEIELHYWAFPMDEEGNWPLIPDNIHYIEACFWYILKKLIMQGMRHPTFSYDYCDAKWGKYCSAAANNIAFPNPDKMDRFIQNWVRMIPPTEVNEANYEHDTTA